MQQQRCGGSEKEQKVRMRWVGEGICEAGEGGGREDVWWGLMVQPVQTVTGEAGGRVGQGGQVWCGVPGRSNGPRARARGWL